MGRTLRWKIVTTRQRWIAAGAIVISTILGSIACNHSPAPKSRQTGDEAANPARQAYFQMLQPVALSNCDFQRFGEADDGGYLMCGNLLGGVQAVYSYGISGYDGWGCDVSIKAKVTVHEYDCFNTTEPKCPKGALKFHAECVGDKKETVDGRVFDTVANQLFNNGDASKRIVMKMDVEGAEWDSFLAVPDDVFQKIDQLLVEFHEVKGTQEQKQRVVQKLSRFFEVGHIHYNNATCSAGYEPFPSYAYEVPFVNKRLAVVDPGRRVVGPHQLDAPNLPSESDCQPKAP
jgi:hypothetical protein